jgi:hypothetical protein
MCNVIDNRLRSIKHIQKKFFGGVDVIMTGDFDQATLMTDSWIISNIKNNVNALTYELLNDSNKITGLNFTNVKNDMLVELCGRNYATFDGLVSGVNGIFKTLTIYFEITVIWIMFQKIKIEALTKIYIIIIITTTLNQNGH